MTLIYSLKPDFNIDSLLNWKKIQKILTKKTSLLEEKFDRISLNQIGEIPEISASFKDQFLSRKNIENSIGYEVQTYFKLYSKKPFKNKKKELLNIYPLSKLLILTKTNCNFINLYHDQTSSYHLSKEIDFDKINEVDSILKISILKNGVSGIKYNQYVDFYLNKGCIPYLIKDKYTIEIKDKKMFNSTHIELIN